MTLLEQFFLKPFSIDGSDTIDRLSDVTNRWVKTHEQNASAFENAGMEDEASKERSLAKRWRGIATLTKAEAVELAQTLQSICSECIDAILVLAEKNNSLSVSLCGIACQTLEGFREIAASGRELVASIWMNTLSASVCSFESLAEEKPELFRKWARKQFTIPGLISRDQWNETKNNRLLELLQQGEECAVKASLKGKQGRALEMKGVTLLAIRLMGHIDQKLMLFEKFKQQATVNEAGIPDWCKAAMKTKSLSSRTWEEWAKIAWQLLKESSRNGKPAQDPAITRIFNVRKKHTNYYGAEVSSESIPENDLKEAFFGAFERLATGQSSRSRQRLKNKKKRTVKTPKAA